MALSAADAEVGVLDDDVEREAGRVPLFGAASDEADAAEEHEFVAEPVFLSVEFGEAEEDCVGDIASGCEVHHVTEACFSVFGIAALLCEGAEEEFAATGGHFVFCLCETLEDFCGVDVHLLVEVTFADAELGVCCFGGVWEAFDEGGAFCAGEVVAERFEVEVCELELGFGFLVFGNGFGGFVCDDPAAEDFFGGGAGGFVFALDESFGEPAQVIGGEFVFVFCEERFVELEGFPCGGGIAHAEADGGFEEGRPFEFFVDFDGGELAFVAEAEEGLGGLGAEFGVDAGGSVDGLSEGESGEFGESGLVEFLGETGEA